MIPSVDCFILSQYQLSESDESKMKEVGKPAFFVYSDGIRRQAFNFVK